MSEGAFRRCSTCRTDILYGAEYYKCSVSTCNRRATALYFCSVPCWDAHVPDAKHRDAWAEKETAPSGPEARVEEKPVARRIVAGASRPHPASAASSTSSESTDDANLPQEVLVVMSKVKGYIKARSEMRTSEGVSDPLSDHLRKICTAAIRSAATNERSTVLARDVEAALRGETASE